jgi:hypothetical protein
VKTPFPEAADVIWSQLTLLKALHGQPAPMVTESLPSVAAGPMVAVVGESVRLLGEPSSVIWSVVETKLGIVGVLGTPTPTAPAREARQGLAAMVYVKLPLKVPWVLGGTVIQLASLTPVLQMQLAPTWTVPVPPVTGKFMDVGETVKAQTSPAWLTVMLALATEMVPMRGLPVGFCKATNPTVPLPDPVCPA